MKSVGILTAALAAMLVAGCRTSNTESDGMMTGKEGAACSTKKEGSCAMDASAQKEGSCPMTAAAKKDGSCGDEAKATSAKKEGCCASEAKATEAKKSGCCAEGKTAVKDGCCNGKDISVACADCKKACEAAGGCDTGKKCDEKACEKP
jgi:hypothetical protein